MAQRRGYKRRPRHVMEAAREEVARLFDEAERHYRAGNEELARRRVRAARRTAMKVQLRIPEFWQRYCRRCNSYLVLGENATMRFRNGMRVRRCLACGAVRKVRAPLTHPNSSSPAGASKGLKDEARREKKGGA